MCGLVVLKSRQDNAVKTTDAFKAFQRNFLGVYLCMMMADWMQGPYVYALYEHYGFTIGQIGQLFIVGFGSSMVFGTFIGSLADRYGRKANAIIFAIMYSLSCFTKHSPRYDVLLLGRLLGGIATSILMSAFETWMVHEHKAGGFPEDWLSGTFSNMTFGNGMVAIVAGIIASGLAANFGPVAPFDASLVLLVAGGFAIAFTWKENYGDNRSDARVCNNFRAAWSVLASNEKVFLLGLIQSCFEGAMYIFVFMWTPALEATLGKDEKLPHGLVFAGFMICVMIGSRMFSSLLTIQPVEALSRVVFLVATAALAVPVLIQGTKPVLLSFCVFEVCCGIYFPSIGTMRGKFVPEEVRSTVMNIFRIGLNIIVVLVLANIGDMAHDTVFMLCALLLTLACLCQHRLFILASGNISVAAREKVGIEDDEERDAVLACKEDASA